MLNSLKFKRIQFLKFKRIQPKNMDHRVFTVDYLITCEMLDD